MISTFTFRNSTMHFYFKGFILINFLNFDEFFQRGWNLRSVYMIKMISVAFTHDLILNYWVTHSFFPLTYYLLFLYILLLYDIQEKPDFVPLWKIFSFFFLKVCSILDLWNSKCQPFIFRYWTIFVNFVLILTRPFHLKIKVFLQLKKTLLSSLNIASLTFVQEFSFKHANNPHIRSPFSVCNILICFS